MASCIGCRKYSFPLFAVKVQEMVRMHGPGKGKAASALPYRRTPPSWLKLASREIVQTICKLARKGLPPSMIGLQLRDTMGIAQVKNITGRKILRLLKHNGLAPEILKTFTASSSVRYQCANILNAIARTLTPSSD